MSQQAMQDSCAKAGINPNITPVVVDLAAGAGREHYMVNVCPTILACRAKTKSYWISNLKRPFVLEELLKLQGFLDPARIGSGILAVPQGELRFMIGNAMTCTVLEAILRQLLASLEL